MFDADVAFRNSDMSHLIVRRELKADSKLKTGRK